MKEAATAEHMPAVPEATFGSHEVRLSGRLWVLAIALIGGAFIGMPVAWQAAEHFRPTADYRIPYALSSDYWLFARYCQWVASQGQTFVVGDSVTWGQYVGADQTLPHCLNQLAGQDRFANMGMDGMHPAALAGLIHYYGRAISGRNVIVHCNLLWMSTKKHDLQVDKEFQFNHPALVPQFFPRIACYRAPYPQRLSIVVQRLVPLLGWTDHLRVAYFDQMTIPAWTIEHPYGDLLKAPIRGLPAPDRGPHQAPVPWTQAGLTEQDFPWVPLDTSFQWRSFRRALETLQARGNRLFVLVGPFNEHMLTPESLAAYVQRRDQVAAWLDEHSIPHYVAPALPSEDYADASHPLSEGYALLAQGLFNDQAFARFDSGRAALPRPDGGVR